MLVALAMSEVARERKYRLSSSKHEWEDDLRPHIGDAGGASTHTAKSLHLVEYCGYTTSQPAAAGDSLGVGQMAESTFWGIHLGFLGQVAN